MGQWDEAGELWKKETGNPKIKIAGRAAYNMAIISEIDGDLEAALNWARKAWGDYNIKLALDYVRILENRQYKSDVLKEDQGKGKLAHATESILRVILSNFYLPLKEIHQHFNT